MYTMITRLDVMRMYVGVMRVCVCVCSGKCVRLEGYIAVAEGVEEWAGLRVASWVYSGFIMDAIEQSSYLSNHLPLTDGTHRRSPTSPPAIQAQPLRLSITKGQ